MIIPAFIDKTIYEDMVLLHSYISYRISQNSDEQNFGKSFITKFGKETFDLLAYLKNIGVLH